MDYEEMIRHMGRDLCVKDLWENRFVYHKTIHNIKYQKQPLYLVYMIE